MNLAEAIKELKSKELDDQSIATIIGIMVDKDWFENDKRSTDFDAMQEIIDNGLEVIEKLDKSNDILRQNNRLQILNDKRELIKSICKPCEAYSELDRNKVELVIGKLLHDGLVVCKEAK